MLLAIDVANTNIVLGCVQDGDIGTMARMTTDEALTADEYAVKIKSILEMRGVSLADVKDCIISSVVPPITGTLKRAVKYITGQDALVVGPGVKTGLNIKIDNPAQLGSGLVVDAVAVINQYPLPAVIVDIGTATTLSVIDAKGQYIGGMIIPGVKMSLAALSSTTAQLPYISIEEPTSLIGKNTVDCMRSGVVIGHAAMLDGIISRIEEELGEKASVITTGKLSSLIIPHSRHKITYDEKLPLKGLYYIYKKNRSRA